MTLYVYLDTKNSMLSGTYLFIIIAIITCYIYDLERIWTYQIWEVCSMYYITYKDKSGKTKKIATAEFRIMYECPVCGSREMAFTGTEDDPCTNCEERREKEISMAFRRAMEIFRKEQNSARDRTVQCL